MNKVDSNFKVFGRKRSVPVQRIDDLESTIKLGFAMEDARSDAKKMRKLVESITGKETQASPKRVKY